MNKAELITAAAEKAGITRKDAEKAISAALEVITGELVAGERVGRNPRTREEITIAASRVPQFKAGKALKDAVAK